MPECLGRTPATEAIILGNSIEVKKEMDATLLHIITKYSDKILLKDSDRKPKFAKKKVKKSSVGMIHKQKLLESVDDWEGPPPWDLSLGGDGRPKFLCDVMVSNNFSLSVLVLQKFPILRFGWANSIVHTKLSCLKLTEELLGGRLGKAFALCWDRCCHPSFKKT